MQDSIGIFLVDFGKESVFHWCTKVGWVDRNSVLFNPSYNTRLQEQRKRTLIAESWNIMGEFKMYPLMVIYHVYPEKLPPHTRVSLLETSTIC